MKELALTLEDTQWEKTEITHDRHVARAIVVDEGGFFYFVRVVRDDIFGNGAFIETAAVAWRQERLLKRLFIGS